tara:strand:+ start:240 stop:455 length:216 start_codon:yes stop_codon:yes gene_type:complete
MKLSKYKKDKIDELITNHKRGEITYNEVFQYVQKCGFSKQDSEFMIHPPLGENDIQLIPEENLEGLMWGIK